MKRVRGWKRLFRVEQGIDTVRDDVDAELEHHMEGRIQELMEQGVGRDEARRQVVEQFGDVSQVRDECAEETRRDVASRRRTEFIGSVFADFRFAWRAYKRQPGFPISSITILGITIAAACVVLSLVNAYLLRTLPFPDPERLMMVHPAPPNATDEEWERLVPDGLYGIDWPQRDEVIEHSIAWDLDAFAIVGDDEPESVDGAWVSAGFFSALGIVPEVGRWFTDAETGPLGPPVAVISNGLWKRRFGSDPNIVGRSITVFSTDRPHEREVFTVIGVLPQDFWFLHRFTDLLVPLRGPRLPSIIKLQSGVSAERAVEHLTAVARAQLAGVNPAWQFVLQPAQDDYVESVRPTLVILSATVTLVLLIACGNIAVLLSVRAIARERELSIRRALGAHRVRIVRQLLTEGLVLAGCAAILGTALAWVALQSLGPVIQDELGPPVPGGTAMLTIDMSVLAMMVAICGTTGVVFGLVPAVTTSAGRVLTFLKEGARTGTDTGRRRFARSSLVTLEVALSLALLIGAALVVRSAVHLSSIDLGFVPDRVLRANVSLRLRSYDEPSEVIAFTDGLLERVRALPDVQAASIVTSYPFRSEFGWPIEVEHVGAIDDPAAVRGVDHTIAPGHFETLHIPVIRGRPFTVADRIGAPEVAIVSESLARQLWPNQDPIGRRIRPGGMRHGLVTEGNPWRTVVGVVGDITKTLTGQNLGDVYIPQLQAPRTFFDVLVRTGGDPLAAVPAIKSAARSVDPEQPLAGIRTLQDIVAEASRGPRFLASLLAGFSLFAAALAVFGLYAVIAYAASQRSRDVAIYMALGARGQDVTRMFLLQGSRVVGAGLIVGLLASTVLSQTLTSQIHGISRLDIVAYATAVGLLLAAAAMAVWHPAHRAARTDPMTALKT